jgi:hypothetical protein
MRKFAATILAFKAGAQVAELMLRPFENANQGALQEDQILRDNNQS